MAEVPGSLSKVLSEEVDSESPLSESLTFKLAANVNGLIDRARNFSMFRPSAHYPVRYIFTADTVAARDQIAASEGDLVAVGGFANINNLTWYEYANGAWQTTDKRSRTTVLQEFTVNAQENDFVQYEVSVRLTGNPVVDPGGLTLDIVPAGSMRLIRGSTVLATFSHEGITVPLASFNDYDQPGFGVHTYRLEVVQTSPQFLPGAVFVAAQPIHKSQSILKVHRG